MIGAALPISLKYVTLGTFQACCYFLKCGSNVGDMMQRWIAIASELPDTHDARDNVVKGLLRMASQEELRPYLPVVAWEWLKKRPVLGCETGPFRYGDWESGLQMVQTLGDIELITSYLFVIWSEWNPLRCSDCEGMQRLIREELNGIHAVGYRGDLIQRLDYVLSQFDRGYEYLRSHQGGFEYEHVFLSAKQKYEGFRRDLLEVDEEAAKILAGMSSKVVASFCRLTYIHA